MEWYHVWWPWLTSKRVARVGSIRSASCLTTLHNRNTLWGLTTVSMMQKWRRMVVVILLMFEVLDLLVSTFLSVMLINVNEMCRNDGVCWSHTTLLYTLRPQQPFYFVVDFPENNGSILPSFRFRQISQRKSIRHLEYRAKIATAVLSARRLVTFARCGRTLNAFS